MAIDGVMLDIPETDANLANYPKASGGTRRPYPQVRIVGLGESGTHALLAARIGSIHDGERELAAPLAANVGPDMLVTADRGFFSFPLWRTFLLTGAALLWRVTATVQLPVLQALPDGSYLSEINRVRGGRARILLGSVADPHLATHIPVRVIEYRVDTGDGAGPELFRLITTILDPAQVDAHALADCYHQRWEFESSLREVECQLLEPGCTLRSKTPEMIRQELWGLFLTHYAIRSFMTEAADTVDLDPDRLSTIRAINIVRRTVTDPAALSPHGPKTAASPGDQ